MSYMRYVVWAFAIICQIGNLVCLYLITKKENISLKSKKTLHMISIMLQLMAIALLSYLIFVD